MSINSCQPESGSAGGEDLIGGSECDCAGSFDVELGRFGFEFGKCVGAEQRRVDS